MFRKKITMNLESRKTDSSLFDSLCAVVFLMGGVSAACAEPGPQGQDAERMVRHEQRVERTNLRQMETRLQEERRRAYLANLRESVSEPGPRGNVRLTPDERKMLRSHINQAGQDLYTTPAPHPKD